MAMDPQKVPLHCMHCGRPVLGTRHTRTSYRVDYYTLHTGVVEPVTVQRADDSTVTVFRLLDPVNVVTCVECYKEREVREERERLFRPELAPAEALDVAG